MIINLKLIIAKLTFFAKTYRYKVQIDDLKKRLASLSLAKPVTLTSQMVGVIEWPYIHSQWDVSTRLDKIATHYEILSELESNLAYVDACNGIELLDINYLSEGVKVVIDKASWFAREGELLINLFRYDLRVVSIAFTLGYKDNNKVAYIGAIQGIHSGISTAQSLGIFKLMTKDFHGLRPRSLLLEVLKVVLKKLGVSYIYAVSDQNRHHRHLYFRNLGNTVFNNDYNAIWLEHGGILDKDIGFYQLTIQPAIKDLAEIPSRKRSQYKKKYEIIQSFEAIVDVESKHLVKTDAREVSADMPNWQRESKSFFTWDPSRSLLASIRSYQSFTESSNPIKYMLKVFAIIRHRFWSVITGAEIPLNVKIGGGLLIPHPNGIVIHADAVIGVNCIIFQQVTIGTRGEYSPPKIGGHVDIGAGAKLIGNITIGKHVKIGANAVVITDVPDGKTAVGIPAKII